MKITKEGVPTGQIANYLVTLPKMGKTKIK